MYELAPAIIFAFIVREDHNEGAARQEQAMALALETGQTRNSATYLGAEKVAAMHRLSSTTRQMRSPSLSRRTRPAGIPESLRLSRPLSIPSWRISRPKGSVISAEHREHKAPRLTTEKKMLAGIWAVFLMGVVYSLWLSMQVIVWG